MELDFIKMNPCGNTTVLIRTSLPRARYGSIAAQIMQSTCLCAEQVGFIEPPQQEGALARLHMMGGEFCGNASRSFAAWLAKLAPLISF